MTYLDITIEDHVIPQLLTSALEAYDIQHPMGRKKLDRLETFGLLWGYVIPEREDRSPRVISSLATVETSALRKNDSVQPDLDSLNLKIEFVRKYWPHLEVVGTFHSHPYSSLKETREIRGWEGSDGDFEFWPSIHESLFPATPFLAHLIVTVAKMDKRGWALPKEIADNSGLEMSMDNRKIWITSYGTEIIEDVDTLNKKSVVMDRFPNLDVPALTNRIINGAIG